MNTQTQSTSQIRNLTDFAQGDHPDAGNSVNYRNSEKLHDAISEDEIFNTCIKTKQKLASCADKVLAGEEDSDTSTKSFSSLSHHQSRIQSDDDDDYDNFKKYSSQALADLRRESKSLLSSKLSSVTSTTVDLETNEINKASIFELCLEDRKRVAHLIEELASSHERVVELELKLNEKENEASKSKQKSSDLMKKVDILGEKICRLENEKAHVQEKHLESLTALHNKVAIISDQFELSVKEIQQLKNENLQLKAENQELQMSFSLAEIKIKAIEDSNKKTKHLYDTAVLREKTLKNQIRTISTNLEQKIQEEERHVISAKTKEGSDVFNRKMSSSNSPILHTRTGVGETGKNVYSKDGQQINNQNIITSSSATPKICELKIEDFQPFSPEPGRFYTQKIIANEQEDQVLQDLFFKF